MQDESVIIATFSGANFIKGRKKDILGCICV